MTGPAIVIRRARDEPLGPPGGFDFTLPPGRYAVLPKTAALRRHTINLLAGLRLPNAGRVWRNGLASWPVGRGAFLRGPMRGGEILAMLARIYDFDAEDALSFLHRALPDPSSLDVEAQSWNPYARQEFEFAVSLLPSFSIYVVDGSVPLETRRLGALWRLLIEPRLESGTLLMTANSKLDMAHLCRKAIVASDEGLRIDDDLDAALVRYEPAGYGSSGGEPSDAADDDEPV